MPDRQCRTCTAAQQQEFGCDARKLPDGSWEKPALSPLKIDDQEDFRCPRRGIKDEPLFWSRLLTMFRGYKNGFLPDEGSVASQSARGWALLTVLDGFMQEAQTEALDQIRQKNK